MNKRVMEGRKEGTNWVLNQSMMFFLCKIAELTNSPSQNLLCPPY